MAKKFFDYETESGEKVVFPRNHFMNISRLGWLFDFNFSLLRHEEAYDIYSDTNSDALIYVVGGDAHCHTSGKKGQYEEGIAILCEEGNKDELIKKISKVK